MTIANCGRGENGYRNQQAGDQTGREWYVRSWYNYPWNVVLRHPNASIREDIANLATLSANNNNIGYDQADRTSFWTQLQAAGYNPSKISKKCEADCSAGVAAIVKAVGYRKGNSKLQGVSKDCYTGNLKPALKSAGFEVFSASKYLSSDAYLLRGDILLNEGAHTCINLTNGGSSSQSDTTGSSDSGLGDLRYTGPKMITEWQRQRGTTTDGYLSGQCVYNRDNVLHNIQRNCIIIGSGGSMLVRSIQALVGATQDGHFGPDTVKKLQIWLKARGYYTGNIDGSYGPQTSTAVGLALQAGAFK